MSSQHMKKLMESIDRLSMMEEEESSVTDEQIQELITGFEKGLAILSKMVDDEQLDEAGWKSKLGSLALAGGLAMGLGGAKDASAQHTSYRIDQARAAQSQQEVTGFKRQEITKMAMCSATLMVVMLASRNNPDFNELMETMKPYARIIGAIRSVLVETPAEKAHWELTSNVFMKEVSSNRISPQSLHANFRSCIEELEKFR